MLRTIASEFASFGRLRMSSCQALSLGKICIDSSTRSASGVSNISGRVMVSAGSNTNASEASSGRLDNHDLDVARTKRGDDLLIDFVVGDDAMQFVETGDRR